jgi:hypothetical protein
MALSTVELSLQRTALPGNVTDFIRDAQQRIDEFTELSRSEPIPAFVPSDFAAAYVSLEAIDRLGLATGRLFCEWGSGFGVVTGLAALTEFDACGIEIEPLLVEQARRLTEDFDLPCEFACGSFIPDDAEEIAINPSEMAWLSTDAPDAYAELQLNVDDFDVIYAYPWPDEQDILGDLFDQFASDGALLCTFESPDEVLVRRKVRRRRR